MKKIFRNKFIIGGFAMATALYACSDSFLEVPPTGSLDESLLNGALGLERSIIAAY